MSGVHEIPSRQFSMDEIRKATCGFNKSRILGEGGFGRVYMGVIDDESTFTFVAVKQTLNPESRQGIQGLETEIQMLSKCRHSNLVNLLGYCNENQKTILVYEYMSRGNLADHLYGNKGSSLTWKRRLKICIGAARGLDYLHTGTGLSQRIVHLDIKSDNILLDDDWAAKIADLGLSQIGPANKQNTQVNTFTLRGTPGYVAPEYLTKHTYSRKSDVYSYGVVLLEVLTGTSVWGGQIIPKSADLAEWIQQHLNKQTLDQIVDPKIVSKVQPGSLKRFANIAIKMLHLDPEKRPSMSSVVAKLESALGFRSSSPAVDKDVAFEVGHQGETSRNLVPGLLGKEPNVFGEPIGDKEAVQRGLDPTRLNRARAASYKFTEDKFKDFMGDLLKKWGNANMTICILYNGTGETLSFVTSRNRSGDTEPFQYPAKIHNGQYGVYLNPIMPTGSGGAVVYRGRCSDNASCDTMIAWSIRTGHNNTTYCEINEAGHFDVTDWDAIFNKAKFAGSANKVIWKDCYTEVKMLRDTPPTCAAFFKLVSI